MYEYFVDENSYSSKSGRELRRVILAQKKQTIAEQDFSDCHLFDVGAGGVAFRNCDFSRGLIEQSYFRNCTFKNCQFTGTRFVSSNLEGAEFISCDFSYAKFQNTEINFENIRFAMPSYPNVKRELLHSLRANAISIGRNDDASKFYIKEMETTQEHLKKIVRLDDQFNHDKYKQNWRGRLRAWWRLQGIKLEKLLWGYGEQPWKILVSAIVVVLLLATITWSYLCNCYANRFLEIFLWTLGNFLGVTLDSPDVLANDTKQAMALFTGFLGFVFLGIFGASLFRRVARR